MPPCGIRFIRGYTFKAGSYIYVNSPTISRSEWHPFSIIQVPGKVPRAAFYVEVVSGYAARAVGASCLGGRFVLREAGHFLLLPPATWLQEPKLVVSPYSRSHVALLRGAIVNRTYDTYRNLYIKLLSIKLFGPIYYGPP